MVITIGKRTVGDGQPCFIVAELSANHKQSLSLAKETIHAAKEAGADAVKLQTYTADTLTLDCPNDLFKLPPSSPWAGKTLYNLYQEAYTPWEWHNELKDLAGSLDMELFSSPFDPTSAEFLHNLNMPAYKIASFEIFDIPLIRLVASYQKPVIISTGAADENDIKEAVKTCYSEGNKQIILLQCTSAYPAPTEKANLSLIPLMKEQFKALTGLSDHTNGIIAPVASAAIGACMIEKHFILNHNINSLDGAFSLDAKEFKEMVKYVRDTEAALGSGNYQKAEEVSSAREIARSLFVAEDIKEGETLTEQNIRSIRPGAGLHPKYLPELLGKKAACDLPKGTPLEWKQIKP